MEALPPVTETSDQLLLLSLYFGQFIRTLSEIRHSIATTCIHKYSHYNALDPNPLKLTKSKKNTWNLPAAECFPPNQTSRARPRLKSLLIRIVRFFISQIDWSMNGSELIWLSMNGEMFMILTFLFQLHPLLPFFRQKILQLVQPKVKMINLIRSSSF